MIDEKRNGEDKRGLEGKKGKIEEEKAGDGGEDKDVGKGIE